MTSKSKVGGENMKILNLYSGIGGNRKLWGDDHDGFYVGIEGVVMERIPNNYSVKSLLRLGDGKILYGVWTGETKLYCTEDYLEKID